MLLCLKYGACFKIWPLTLSTCMFWLALDTVTETFVHVLASDCLTDCKLRAVIYDLWLVDPDSRFYLFLAKESESTTECRFLIGELMIASIVS